MTNNYAIFILSHGRPNTIDTLEALNKSNYTGDWFVVVDNEDARLQEYKDIYEDKVLVFDKKAVADVIDDADTSGDRRAVIYARHASQKMAKDMGYKYMLQLDDDYVSFYYRFPRNDVLHTTRIKDFNAVCEAMFKWLDDTNSLVVAFCQGGDLLGGIGNNNYAKGVTRKAMNSFFIRTDRYVDFIGKINDDVNMYVLSGMRGELVQTTFNVQLVQRQTQTNSGGMSELYADEGTYTKSFYSVMMAPSCVTIAPMGTSNRRLHHAVAWDYAVPKILNKKYKKAKVNK